MSGLCGCPWIQCSNIFRRFSNKCVEAYIFMLLICLNTYVNPWFFLNNWELYLFMGLLSSDADTNVELINIVNWCFKIPYFIPTLIFSYFQWFLILFDKEQWLAYLQLFFKMLVISIQWLSVLPRNPWIFKFLGTEVDGRGNDKRTKYKHLQQIF